MTLPLSQRLRADTAELHRQAERAGIMSELLRGRLERGDYVVLLRSLHVVYAALEERLGRLAAEHPVAALCDRALHRTSALAADLSLLHGEGWAQEVRPVAAGTSYAARIESTDDRGAVAHAYVRYLGDLSGGQALGRVVRGALRLADGVGTAFYHFPRIADTEAHKETVRTALDRWPLTSDEADVVVAEAREAFRWNVRMFEGVALRTMPSVVPPPRPDA